MNNHDAGVSDEYDLPDRTSVRLHGGLLLAGIYVLYLLAAMILTWPVAARIGSHLPGWWGDPQVYYWNIWWLKKSIFELHQSPLWCSYVAWPFGASFAFHTHTMLNSSIALALEPLGINWAASLTLLFLNSFALTGLGTFLWCREFGAGKAGAFAGGFLVTFCVYRLGLGIAHYNILSMEWLPLFWLFLKRAIEGGRVRSFFSAALFLLLTFWQTVQMFMFGVLFGGLIVVVMLWRNPRRLTESRFWVGALAAAALLVLGTLPYWLAVLPLLARGEYAPRDHMPVIGADVLSFFLPWTHHLLLGKFTAPVYERFEGVNTETAYVGCVTLILTGIGVFVARRRRLRTGWLLLAGLVFLVLTFGDHVRVAGEDNFRIFGKLYTVWLPGDVLKHIPGLNQFRVYSRFILLAVFAFSVPAALAVDWIVSRMRTRVSALAATAAILLLYVLEILPFPYLTHPVLSPDQAPFGLLKRIADDPEKTTVYTIPPTIGAAHEQYMQMFHGKPVFGGVLGRWPDYLFPRYLRVPVFATFLWERQGFLDEQEALETLTPEYVLRFLSFHNIKYIILAPSPKFGPLRRIVEARFPVARQWTEGYYVLYELEYNRPDDTRRFDMSKVQASPYVGRNFWYPEPLGVWATAREAELVFPVRGTTWTAVRVEIVPFVYDAQVEQTAEVFLNGARLGAVTLSPSPRAYEFALPPGTLDDRTYSTLAFRFAYCVSPAKVGLSSDGRALAASVGRVEFLERSRDEAPRISRD